MEALEVYKEEMGKLEVHKAECRAAKKEVSAALLWSTLTAHNAQCLFYFSA
jgi:hypothetical protein